MSKLLFYALQLQITLQTIIYFTFIRHCTILNYSPVLSFDTHASILYARNKKLIKNSEFQVSILFDLSFLLTKKVKPLMKYTNVKQCCQIIGRKTDNYKN